MDSPPKLSLLLATVENRADMFAKLHAELSRQAEGRPVELVVACDAKQISIGKKRQNLLEAATGEYVAFIDDDDWIAEDYVERVLKALATNPDCVGFLILCTHNGKNPQKAIASMRYRVWGENQDGYTYTRSIYHKTPHLRSLALKVGFRDLRYGEDRFYSQGLMNMVNSEAFIPETMYFYRFVAEPFGQKYGLTGPMAKGGSMGMPSKRAPRLDYKGRRVG